MRVEVSHSQMYLSGIISLLVNVTFLLYMRLLYHPLTSPGMKTLGIDEGSGLVVGLERG